MQTERKSNNGKTFVLHFISIQNTKIQIKTYMRSFAYPISMWIFLILSHFLCRRCLFFSAARFTYFHLKNGKGKSGRARERLILSRASILHEFPKMVSLMKFMLGKMVLLVRAITTYFARFALCLLFFISLITFIVLLVCCCSHLFCNFFRSLISFTNCMVAAWNLTKPEPDLRGQKRYILRAIVMAAKLIKYT